ncbi:unnamed protein product, partial [Symbiodinium sp. KB8]
FARPPSCTSTSCHLAMEQLSNLWGKLKDGSLCRERPLEVWGVSLVLVGGVALLAQAVLSSDSKPTAAQAAFEEGKAVVLASGKAVKVVRVPNTSSGISAAAATLGKQLGSSPLTAAFAAANLDAAGREKAATWLYRTILKTSVPNKSNTLTLQTEDASAVGIWYPPGTSFDTWDFINAGGLCYTLMFSGWERRLRFPAHGQVVSIKRRTALRKFDGKGYYLMAAGAGTGDEQDVEAVVKPVLALADKEGLPAITESDTPARKALLEGLGFKAVDSVAALSVGVEIMLRQPSAV